MNKPKAAHMLTIGFALFSMFFGAGNVIFPPFLGLQSGTKWIGGFTAYFFADVLLALFALFALLREGSSERVLDRIGKKAAAVLMTTIILCIGPMLAIPRTAATTYEMGISILLPKLPGWLFSVLFFAVILALSIKQSAVVDVIGKFLTPILLAGLFALIIVGVIHPLGAIDTAPTVDSVVVTGIQSGYQTMDVLAALVFGAVLIKSARDKGYEDKGGRMKVLVGAGVIAGLLLFLVYFGLAYLGASSAERFSAEISRAELVIAIVQLLLGKPGLIIFTVVVAFACVTTAVALVCSVADHFAMLFRGKISYQTFVILFCVFSAVVANLGLDTIVSIAAPILGLVYPPVLVLTVVTLLFPKLPNSVCISAVAGALFVSILSTISSFGVSMPWLSYLPLSSVDMNWLVPAIVCGLGGFLFRLPWLERDKFDEPEE